MSIPLPLSKKAQVRCTKNDEVKGWLDDMKAQSPPRFESLTDEVLDADAQEAAATAQYAAWMASIAAF